MCDTIWINLLFVAEGDWLKSRIDSLALSIGLILCLNRADEASTPSFPLECDCHLASNHRIVGNASDKRLVVRLHVPNTNGLRVVRPTPFVANFDIVISGKRETRITT